MPKRRRTRTLPTAAAMPPGAGSSASAGSTPSASVAHGAGGPLSPVDGAPLKKRAKRKKEPKEEAAEEEEAAGRQPAAAAAMASTPAAASSSHGRRQAPFTALGRRVDSVGDVEMADTAPSDEQIPTPAASNDEHSTGSADAPRVSLGAAAAVRGVLGVDAAAGSMVAAAAAASSDKAPSAFKFKCDSNSLSVIFSFLNMRDFLSSTRVSPQWRAVSGMHTAWPKQPIESLISSLQSDNYDDPNVRRLRIEPMTRMHNGRRFAHLTHLLQSRTFSQVNDIRFVTYARCTQLKERADAQAALLDLAKFPYLQTLNICTTPEYLQYARPGQTDDFLERFCQALGGKLRALFLSAPSDGIWYSLASGFELHLHHFAHLRVLVVDDEISGDALWQLQQLEFFHGVWTPSLVDVIRTMSVERSLKGVSLACSDFGDDPEVVATLVNALCGQPPPHDDDEDDPPTTFTPTTKPAQLTTLTLRGFLLETSTLMPLVQHLTTLKHLVVDWAPSEDAWDMRVVLPQLETLKLTIDSNSAMDAHPQPFLPPCPTLKSFSLTSPAVQRSSAISACPTRGWSRWWRPTFRMSTTCESTTGCRERHWCFSLGRVWLS